MVISDLFIGKSKVPQRIFCEERIAIAFVIPGKPLSKLPDAEKLLQLCRVFGISADELLGENAKADDASDFLSLPLWRWSLRVISPPLAFAGTAAALTGLTGAVYHALTADQWYTDFGRFGTALRSTWCGAVLSAGLLLLAIALALLVFEVLLSKRD